MRQAPKKYAPLLNDFINLLEKEFTGNIVSAVLYGSVARWTERKDSDIDVCLVFKHLPESRHKRTLLIFPVIKAVRERESYQLLYRDGYLPEISPVLYTSEEIENTKPVFLDMVDEGIVLFDDGTWNRKISDLRHRMEELGTHKVILPDGGYYWVIKPGLRLGEVVSL